MSAIPRPFTIIPGSARPANGTFYGLNGQTIVGDATGGWTFTANGTNQSITLTPSGTGSGIVGVSPAKGASAIKLEIQSDVSAAGQLGLFDTQSSSTNVGGRLEFGGYSTTTSVAARFGLITGRKENGNAGDFSGFLAFFTNPNSTAAGVTEKMRLASNGNLLLGLTTNSTGVIQLPGTSADINFGATANARIGLTANTTAGDFQISGTSTGSISLDSQSGNVQLVRGKLIGGTNNMIITSGSGNSRTLTLQTTTSGGVATTFMTADASQNTVFAGSVRGNGGFLGSAGGVGLTQASTVTLGKSITVENGLITAFA